MKHFSSTRRAAWAAILVWTAVAISGTPARSQGGPGSYAAAFLKIPVGARLMSSPDVVAGMRPDASLMFSNPALIADLDGPEIFASSSRWLDDLSFNSFGAAIPIAGRGTVLGVGSTLLYSGGLKGYDDALNVVSEQSVYDLSLDVTLSHAFAGTGLSAAAGATTIREHVVPDDGSGVAFHLGASYRSGPTLVQAALRDLGGSVNFPGTSWSIAPEWMVGAARVFDSSLGQFFAGAQVSDSDGYGTRLRLGVDYQINSLFTLRTGFNDNLDEGQPDAPFNAGFGMRYGSFTVEYAYTPQDYFSSAHTFSLGFRFGAPARAPRSGATAPIGDTAPPISDSEPGPPARSAAATFLLVAGSHSWLESAQSEAHALTLLEIPSTVEREGPRFRVVIGRYTTFNQADSDRTRYAARGHTFQIIAR